MCHLYNNRAWDLTRSLCDGAGPREILRRTRRLFRACSAAPKNAEERAEMKRHIERAMGWR
jgi:hypothetical protein